MADVEGFAYKEIAGHPWRTPTSGRAVNVRIAVAGQLRDLPRTTPRNRGLARARIRRLRIRREGDDAETHEAVTEVLDPGLRLTWTASGPTGLSQDP